ncbi:hypothetical protein N8987_05230 [Crocinitomix sp.]|nr:hypothetical protein [Crocinitomix sp.]
MLLRLTLGILALIICFIIPIFFYELLEFLVAKLSAGWVFSSIFIRFLVIIFFAIALSFIFSAFEKTKRIKFWIIFLIALIPGFGISFIEPIYETDYGYFQHNDPPAVNLNELATNTNNAFKFSNELQIICFFTSTCPHCMVTSHKLGMNIAGGQNIDVTVFFPSTKEDRERFINDNNGAAFNSYSIDQEVFLTNAGNTFPATFLVNKNGETINFWSGDQLSFSTLDYFLGLAQ